MIESDTLQPVPASPAPAAKKVGPVAAYVIFIGYTVVLCVIGVMIGKYFFWDTYNKTSLADRQISSKLEELKAKPDDPQILTDLGWGYFQKGEYNQALSYYKKAIDQDKNYFPAQLNLGLAYMQAQKYDMAVSSFQAAVALNSKSPEAHLYLGTADNKLQKYQDALSELAEADKVSPGNVETVYQMGFANEKLGKFSDAAKAYQDALSFDPKYKLAQQGLDRVKDKASGNQ